MKYRKKPVVVEAFRIGHEEAPAWYTGTPVWIGQSCHEEIDTLEGTMCAHKGDWIVRGIKGEQYPVKNDIFEATYEAVNECPPHDWSQDGERCAKCGCKDWMT